MQGSKFHLSVSPGQVDFPPDNKISNICCPQDNLVLDRDSVARQILVSVYIIHLVYFVNTPISSDIMTKFIMQSSKTTT